MRVRVCLRVFACDRACARACVHAAACDLVSKTQDTPSTLTFFLISFFLLSHASGACHARYCTRYTRYNIYCTRYTRYNIYCTRYTRYAKDPLFSPSLASAVAHKIRNGWWYLIQGLIQGYTPSTAAWLGLQNLAVRLSGKRRQMIQKKLKKIICLLFPETQKVMGEDCST